MAVTIESIEALADQLSLQDLQLLIHRLQDKFIRMPPRCPRSVAGIWKDVFPPDLDIEAVVREIRDQWKPELDGFED